MDRQHRRELKHDKFVDEIGALSSKARENQRLLFTIAVAAVGIALIAFGIYFYRANREVRAQDALAKAIDTIESPLIAEGQANPLAKFKTDEEKLAAAEKEFAAVQSGFSGSDASDVAGLYIARIKAAKGDVPAARKLLEDFVDDHPDHLLVGTASYSLYNLRIENNEAPQVVTELNAEIAKAEPALPADSLLVLLAKAYEAQGQRDKSRETYRRIITEFPDSPYALEAQRRVGPA